MHVHRSNRAETLIEALTDLVRRPVAGPFAPECIVVQGRGMERWLAMQLASRLGVWAKPDFPFPRNLVERAFAAASDATPPERDPYQPETMLWAIADLLPAHLEHPAFASIRSYLADDDGGNRRIQLAARIAATFDQYVVFRPQLVLGWEEGGAATAGSDGEWQAILWRALVERLGPGHLAARERGFARAIAGMRALPGFPARVSLFGVSSLPPLYVRVLFALSRVVDVHVFLLSPSREYWAEIRSKREIIHALERAGDEATEEELHLREGHPLLASLGRLGRDFQALLEAGGDYLEDEADLYVDPGVGRMLPTLQSDVLRLLERRHGAADDATAGTAPALPLEPGDRTIVVHACHSPMREVEVLHDQLVALFEEIPDLEPRDVVVLTPAIDAYAPLIDAVFGEVEDARPRIPYRIADRGVRATDEVVDAFSRLLEVVDSRMTATDVLDLLRIAPIRRRFGVEAQDADLLRSWVTRSGIRWGIDAAHRASLGQPAIAENTWRFGLDRLLLGYAMAGEERTLFGDALPYDDVEGTTTETLGRLVELCETLFRFCDELRAPRRLDAWRDDLGRLLATMIASDDATVDQHQEVRGTLAAIAGRAAAAGFGEALPLETVRAHVLGELGRSATARGFLAGGVTFCELVPMRAIPFRVVCLIGMNGDAFPRVRRPLGFDLVARRPRRGDRSAREDDRYLFLEALLSARDRLVVTYVGQSIRDNAELPPSVVVSELLDTLGQSFLVAEEAAAEDPASASTELPSERAQKRIRERAVVVHPLQPFSPRYFRGDGPLRSYARSYHLGAEALAGARRPAPPFVRGPLAEAAEEGTEVAVDELVRFFEHPTREFVRRRLLVDLGREVEPVENREPLALDTLERWKVGDALLARAAGGEDPAHAFAALRASGVLPPGVPGLCTYDAIVPAVRAIAGSAAHLMAGGPLDPVPIDAEIAGVRVRGAIRDLYAQGQVLTQFSKVGNPREIGVWIRHLLLALEARGGSPPVSWVVARGDGDERAVARFGAVADPRHVLEALLEIYRLGRTVPLPLFPRTSRAYAEALLRHAGPERELRALHAARKQYEGSHTGSFAERNDAYLALVFANLDPLSAPAHEGDGALGFTALALALFGPLLEHREEVEA